MDTQRRLNSILLLMGHKLKRVCDGHRLRGLGWTPTEGSAMDTDLGGGQAPMYDTIFPPQSVGLEVRC